MEHPKEITRVVLDGHSLSLEALVAAARFGAAVELAPEARASMARSRALAEKISKEKRVAYGITTGFGDFATVAVPDEWSSQLSTNLILSHCTATGDPYSTEQVRGMMLLRANALCVGLSGVRPLLVEMLVEMLNRGVTPVIPQKGSLGASGDLAPLSHMGLVLLGRGEAFYQGERLPGAEAMARAGIQPLDTLVSKEGLGITNGTCAMTSVGALHLYDALQAARMADLISSLTLTALTGQLDAFQARMHTARGVRFWSAARGPGCRTPTPCAASRRSTARCGTPWRSSGARWTSSSTPSQTTPCCSRRTRRSSQAETSTGSLWLCPLTFWVSPRPSWPVSPSGASSAWSTPPSPTA